MASALSLPTPAPLALSNCSSSEAVNMEHDWAAAVELALDRVLQVRRGSLELPPTPPLKGLAVGNACRPTASLESQQEAAEVGSRALQTGVGVTDTEVGTTEDAAVVEELLGSDAGPPLTVGEGHSDPVEPAHDVGQLSLAQVEALGLLPAGFADSLLAALAQAAASTEPATPPPPQPSPPTLILTPPLDIEAAPKYGVMSSSTMAGSPSQALATTLAMRLEPSEAGLTGAPTSFGMGGRGRVAEVD